MANTFGQIFKISSFGESHGKAIGGIIDGCPAGISIDYDIVQKQLDRRKPGQSKITSSRNENDEVEFLSGIFDNKTLGTPIGFVIKNNDAKIKDYDSLKNSFRPSHADFVYEKKYGIRDYRGGGRSSARETSVRVVAGAIAQQILSNLNIKVKAYVSKVKSIKLEKNYSEYNLENIDNNIIRCPDDKIAKNMISLINQTKLKGDSVGGEITAVVTNVPIGLGEPIYDKLDANLAKAMLSINAVNGFLVGNDRSELYGSQSNDIIEDLSGKTKTNNSGGIQAGISNGNDIFFNVSFKPVSTIMKPQESINNKGEKVILNPQGRHDPCVLPRAVPIVEAMTAIVLLDHFLLNKTNKLK
ncbi:MAG: chorismate synthase [Flavobacteriales bacterium]